MTAPAGPQPGQPTQTPLSLNRNCEDWPVIADPDLVDGYPMRSTKRATLRRIGWLDQKGRVWLATPPTAEFDGGSLTPLLIDARETP